MQNILVAIDFEDQVNLLLDYASKMAKAFNSKIWLMHITAPEPDFVGYDVGPQYLRFERAEELKKEHRMIHGFANMLKAKGFDVEALVIQGTAIEQIIEESKKLKADLLITGQHEHTFLYNALFGNTSAKIIRNSRIPVLVVPFD